MKNAFVTNAAKRRWIAQQKQLHPDCPSNLWDRFTLYVDCTSDCGEFPADFKTWVTR